MYDYIVATSSPDAAVMFVVNQANLSPGVWRDHRNDPKTSVLAAAHVLAAWVHLMRFPRTERTEDAVIRMSSYVQPHADELVEAALMVGSPLEDFEQRALELDGVWGTDEAADSERHGQKILKLFSTFDQERLLVQAVSFLLGMHPGGWHQEFCDREDHVRAVERFIMEKPHLFMAVADYAHAMLNAYRTDVGAPDPYAVADAPLVEVMDHPWVFWRIKTSPHHDAGHRATVFLRPKERAAIRALKERRQSRQDPLA